VLPTSCWVTVRLKRSFHFQVCGSCRECPPISLSLAQGADRPGTDGVHSAPGFWGPKFPARREITHRSLRAALATPIHVCSWGMARSAPR